MIRRLAPPLGWRAQDLLTAGVIARYHRGALPRAGQKPLRGLSLQQRQDIVEIGGDSSPGQRLRRVPGRSYPASASQVRKSKETRFLLIAAQGYSPRDNQAEAIAAARHLAGNRLSPPSHGQADEGIELKPKLRKRKPAEQAKAGRMKLTLLSHFHLPQLTRTDTP